MSKYLGARLLLILLAAAALGGLVRAEGAPGDPPLAAKDLMLAEMSAIRRDVAHDRWETALTRSNKLNDYWGEYQRTHETLKQETVDSFARYFAELQTDLKARSAFKVFFDLTTLRGIITVLKA